MNDDRFVLAPALQREPDGQRWVIRNPRIGTRVELGDIIDFLIEHYTRPNTLAPLIERLGGSINEPPAGLGTLLDAFILLREEELDSIGHGLLNPVERFPIGFPTKIRDIRKDPRARFAVVGAPWDSGGARTNSAALGPTAIRRAFVPHAPAVRSLADASGATAYVNDFEFRRRYPTPPLALDLGDIVVKRVQALEQAGARLEKVTGLVLDAGLVPVTLGGDHSVSFYTVRSLLQRTQELGIIHFDAHHDSWPPVQDDLLSHANPFYFLLRDPKLTHLRQLGIRVADTVSNNDRVDEDLRMSFFSARELRRMSATDAFADLPRDIPYYLTFDVDCLAPHLCESTDTPEAGGLSYYTALELVDYAVRNFPIAGIDLVELGGYPTPSRKHGAAAVAARLLFSAMMATTPFEPLGGYRIAKPPVPSLTKMS